jgi:signal-transduction protein with cAMP-binding, CBS, and nucleotidyltransferase domain
MTAVHLIAHDIPALTVEQTGRDAFHFLSDYHVKHLPVIDGKRLIGILSEEEIFNHKLYDPIGEYDFSMMRRFAIRDTDHLFEVMRVMGDNRLTVMPVVDAEDNYLGLIAQNDLLRFFANSASFAENGAVLVLEMPPRDYSLATIARIIEGADTKILNCFVTSLPGAEMLEVTLKLNRNDLARVISALERYEYNIKETYSETNHKEAMRDRYESLLKYLNV